MSKDEAFCVEERKNRCVLAQDRAEEVRYFIHLESGEECRRGRECQECWWLEAGIWWRCRRGKEM